MGIFNFNAAHVRTWRGDVFLEIASRGSVMPTVGGEGSTCFFVIVVSLIMGVFNFNAAHLRTWRGNVSWKLHHAGA
jgi:hypothetical protein